MTTTLLENICTAISTVGGGVTGITKAFDPAPANIDTQYLPALFAFTGPSTQDDETLGDELVITRRIFRVQVAVIPTGQGDPNTREVKCRPLLENTLKRFRSYQQLGKTAFVHLSRPLSDTGIVVLPEWGGKFIGFEIRLEVAYVEQSNFVE
jgi:hypothetical protein